MHVLIVDDDSKVAAALSRLLRRRGHAVSIANCGESAIGVVERIAPDVVLSDFRMPGMNGAQVLTEVEKLRPGTRCVLLSGYADLPLAQTGEFTFLHKPWDDDELVRACEGPR